MKISKFRLIEVIKINTDNWKFIAVVDVTVCFLSTKRREITKKSEGNWFFVDTGKVVPVFDMDRFD